MTVSWHCEGVSQHCVLLVVVDDANTTTLRATKTNVATLEIFFLFWRHWKFVLYFGVASATALKAKRLNTSALAICVNFGEANTTALKAVKLSASTLTIDLFTWRQRRGTLS